MALEVVNQDRVLDRALGLVRQARQRVWITSPWITQRSANLLLRDVLPRIDQDQLDVRVVLSVVESVSRSSCASCRPRLTVLHPWEAGRRSRPKTWW